MSEGNGRTSGTRIKKEGEGCEERGNESEVDGI